MGEMRGEYGESGWNDYIEEVGWGAFKLSESVVVLVLQVRKPGELDEVIEVGAIV